jgi:hypothetical protein
MNTIKNIKETTTLTAAQTVCIKGGGTTPRGTASQKPSTFGIFPIKKK